LNLLAQIASSNLQNSERLAIFKNEIGERQVVLGRLQYRARLEHVMSVIASHFIALDPEKVDEGIQRSLETLARFTGIDRCYLVLFAQEGRPETDMRVWYSSGPGAPDGSADDLSWKVFNWSLGKLDQFETIHIPRLTGMSPEDEGVAAYLQSRGIKSFTAIPLISNRSAIGYLGFEAVRAELEWPQDILALLKVCAEMFANLLERKWAEKQAKDTQEKVYSQIMVLEQRNQESAIITEMGELLQASRTSDEAYPIIVRFIQRLLPSSSGALYIVHDSKDPAENVIAWGSDQPEPAEHELVLSECWGMRRGHIYVVQDPAGESLCGHLKPPIQGGYVCVPLIAQGGASGVLHIRQPAGGPQGEPFTESQQRLAVKIAEYIAMALTNLKLRDELRSQAIRDPLTGLFNRRYMEETLDREIRRAIRHSTSVGMIMFDIDRMKPINDQFGHDAGDLLLKTLGHALHKMFRGEDVACRYGGDEFTIVLPEATLAEVWRRAEQVREMAKRLNFQYEGKSITPLTLSIGVSAYPDHGLTAERLLLACDAASYAAKSEGGDRIMMGREIET
jgi:diguanylate cyclase (GGDEF)-like protein